MIRIMLQALEGQFRNPMGRSGELLESTLAGQRSGTRRFRGGRWPRAGDRGLDVLFRRAPAEPAFATTFAKRQE